MHWLQALDNGVFHWVNGSLSNPLLDVLMPFVSWNPFFAPSFVLACALLIWKGGIRGRLCVAMLILTIALGDTFVCNTIKHLASRQRPFWVIAEVHLPPGIGRTDSGSFPSSHAANWFAATMVLFIYYRKSIRFMLPAALVVSFSRVYNGVHYPSDVLAGAILGSGYAACGVWTLNALWNWAGRRWFPLWWQRLASMLNPVIAAPPQDPASRDAQALDQHWLRLAYTIIFLLLGINLTYLASGIIGLSEDEAYRWVWSKHLALSYYSKPPLIAFTQFLGTSLWGDNEFGVRFFSPMISAFMGLALLRFMARVVNVRAAFWLSVIVPTVPLLALGSVLMDIDPLSVMFWTLAMIAGWKAIHENAATLDWIWVGLWMGLGFLSKYTALLQLLSWIMVFALLPTARKQLRRPGPYLALLVNLICSIPVLVWNQQNHWVTLRHLAEGGHLDQPWAFTIANLWAGFSVFTRDFLLAEAVLLNPFFFFPVAWAVFAFWRRKRQEPLLVYFCSMGASVFIFYSLLTFHSRVYPNWIAPAILPFLCLGVVYWEERWRAGFAGIKHWLAAGLIIGFVSVVLLHDNNLFARVAGRPLPALFRIEGWKETADAVEAAREKLSAEGKPVFIIGGHYGITSEVTFYLPEARAGVPDHPLVYYHTAKVPENQYYFWPGYHDRKGQNAIFVEVLSPSDHNTNEIPTEIIDEFESVKGIGTVMIYHEGRAVRRIQLTECRGLR